MLRAVFEATASNLDAYRLSLSSKPMNADLNYANQGRITIDNLNEEFIKGTFNATITNNSNIELNLTNGTFNAPNIIG